VLCSHLRGRTHLEPDRLRTRLYRESVRIMSAAHPHIGFTDERGSQRRHCWQGPPKQSPSTKWRFAEPGERLGHALVAIRAHAAAAGRWHLWPCAPCPRLDSLDLASSARRQAINNPLTALRNTGGNHAMERRPTVSLGLGTYSKRKPSCHICGSEPFTAGPLTRDGPLSEVMPEASSTARPIASTSDSSRAASRSALPSTSSTARATDWTSARAWQCSGWISSGIGSNSSSSAAATATEHFCPLKRSPRRNPNKVRSLFTKQEIAT